MKTKNNLLNHGESVLKELRIKNMKSVEQLNAEFSTRQLLRLIPGASDQWYVSGNGRLQQNRGGGIQGNGGFGRGGFGRGGFNRGGFGRGARGGGGANPAVVAQPQVPAQPQVAVPRQGQPQYVFAPPPVQQGNQQGQHQGGGVFQQGGGAPAQ